MADVSHAASANSKGSLHCFPCNVPPRPPKPSPPPHPTPTLCACLQLLKGQPELVKGQSRTGEVRDNQRWVVGPPWLISLMLHDTTGWYYGMFAALHCSDTQHQMSQDTGHFPMQQTHNLDIVSPLRAPLLTLFPSFPNLMIPYIDWKASPPPFSRANFPLQPEVLSVAVCFVHTNSLRL